MSIKKEARKVVEVNISGYFNHLEMGKAIQMLESEARTVKKRRDHCDDLKNEA